MSYNRLGELISFLYHLLYPRAYEAHVIEARIFMKEVERLPRLHYTPLHSSAIRAFHIPKPAFKLVCTTASEKSSMALLTFATHAVNSEIRTDRANE